MLFKNIKIIDKDFTVQEHMNVLTEGAVIRYVGKELPEGAAELDSAEIYDGSNKLLMPSFYDVHCHVPMTMLRGYGEGLPLQRWLHEKIFPFEARLTDEDIYYGTLLGAMELEASGSASISDMYFSINHMADALNSAGMKANICHGLSSFDPSQHITDLKGYKDSLTLLDRIKAGAFGGNGNGQEESRIKLDMCIHAEYTSHETLVRESSAAAKELGLILHTHISETESEHAECKQRHDGRTPVRYFADCGMFENQVLAAHCVYLEEEDVEIMKAAGAYAVHNPSSNLKLGSGIAPVTKRLAQGLNLALGTDGASSNNNLNMMEELHMAAEIARGITRDANAISASDMIRMATLSGALAQGRKDCGRIEEGCRADLIVIDLDKPHMQPDFDTIANVVFSAQASDIVMNMIDGRIVYKNGEYSFIDREKVIYEVNSRFRRILTEL